MRDVVDVVEPVGPLVLAEEGLVDGWDEPPGVAEDEEPDDGQGDSRDPALPATQNCGGSTFALKNEDLLY